MKPPLYTYIAELSITQSAATEFQNLSQDIPTALAVHRHCLSDSLMPLQDSYIIGEEVSYYDIPVNLTTKVTEKVSSVAMLWFF